MSKAVMKRVLEALVRVNASPHLQDLHHAFDEEITALRAALAEPEHYAAQNPLGGPAKVFDAMADAIRAGDDYHATLSRYGFAEVKALAEPEKLPKVEIETVLTVQGGPAQEPVAWMCPDDPDRRTAFSWPGTDRHSDFTVPLYTAPIPQREHITDGSPCWCNPDVFEEDGGNVIVHNYEDNWQQYAKPGETAQQCIERHMSEQDALMKLYATPRRPLSDDQIVDIWAGVSMDYDDQINIIELGRAIERAHGIGEQT